MLIFINIDIDSYISILFIGINVNLNIFINDINKRTIKLSFNLYKEIDKMKNINSFIQIKATVKKFKRNKSPRIYTLKNNIL